MKVAVVGHTEWIQFAYVESIPRPGESVHSATYWEEAAGGGAVAALVLAQLADECLFFTALGDDSTGDKAARQLEKRGVTVYASRQASSTTIKSFVHLDRNKDRAITIMGDIRPSGLDRSLPWRDLATMDAVYFASGDSAALRSSRAAKVLVSTARILPLLKENNLPLDALVGSSHDAAEAFDKNALKPVPPLVVITDGDSGGITTNGERYSAEPVPPSEIKDTYGCGDSFAAGLTLGLGQGMSPEQALRVAAHCGSQAARRCGAFGSK